jgi:hypothetical protein
LEGDLECSHQVGQAQRTTLADLVLIDLDPEEVVRVGVGVVVVSGEAQGVEAVGNEIGDRLSDDTVVRGDGAIPDPLGPPVPSIGKNRRE